ncbi:hypothetical protein NQ317_001979 [Molorchus minor]|uniref:EGF-like calcium-binding domain-containing protein n=1 Tax=Molorchus minor TaxID=1323400 RepID=A0ABQ9JID8_9CUCU|nr:hypothetical protein NQ317_001979 [Molorchus minor]
MAHVSAGPTICCKQKKRFWILLRMILQSTREIAQDYYTEATNTASSTKLSDDKRYALTTISNDLSSMITLDEDEEEATYNVTRAEDNMTITEDFNSNKFLTTTTSVLLDDDAIKDVAYCLRSHKFNEYDRRYETNADTAPRRFFMENPRPPLRSLHWEVRKSCELSFSECVNYLRKKIMYTSLKRVDDTAIVIQEHNWTVNNTLQIQTVDEECKKMRRRDDILADPFEGPLERLQWRSTASYYMCWYTMKEAPELAHLNEKCDNFAYCLDTNLGPNNRDQRADDDQPFSCALYSFCPDPCCPARHLANLQHCWDSPDNPCFEGNPAGQRECAFNRTQNTDFRDIILNRWNVTCRCPKAGFEWNSLYGMCVDVDECATGAHSCDQKLEACVNLEGSFRCACKWGHVWNDQTKACTPSNALSLIKLGRKMEEGDDKKKVSLFGRIARFFSRSNGANAVKNDSRLFLFSVVLFYAAESMK